MDRRSFLMKSTAIAGTTWSQQILQPVLARTVHDGEVLSSGAAFESPDSGDTLFYDDFSKFPVGRLSFPVGQLNGAIQEVHYLANRGVPLGPWSNVIIHLDAWVVSDEDGKPYLEQHTVNELAALMHPALVTGDPEWGDYSLEVKMKPLSLAENAGVVFRYHTNRHYYLFALSEGKYARIALRLPLETNLRIAQWRELAKREFAYDSKQYYSLRVENSGPQIRAYVDGKLLLEVSDSEILQGRAGVTANIPARFQDFRVSAAPEVRSVLQQRITARAAELSRIQGDNPQPKLWKRFATPKFGAGRSVRFGDLNGDGQLEMIIGQNIPRVQGDAHDQISCLTAVTLDGRVLWQIGRPDARNGLLTNDLPFQIHDVDGDGRQEVVFIRDFKIQILDGATGGLKRSAQMPDALPTATGSKPPYQFENGDCVAFVNVSGGERRGDILVKDRYWNFWVYSNNLEPLWQGKGQTGHFPYPFDIDGDGRDEILIGYALWDHDGKQLWSHDDELKDHADSVFIGNLTDDPRAEPRAYVAGSDEGLLIFSRQGEILKHVRVGHAQNASVAKYRPDLPGLQYLLVNFWKNPGIVTLFDADGNILAQEELIHCGSPLIPVNWRGDGQEFALLAGNVHEGGLIDGHLRRVVMFPDDCHPDLCAHALDLNHDGRDEVILWDQEQVWIYTPGRALDSKRSYDPIRNPLYNESNYRIQISLPRWRESKA
jgi:rhamnogalacturonan endolyase